MYGENADIILAGELTNGDSVAAIVTQRSNPNVDIYVEVAIFMKIDGVLLTFCNEVCC